MNVRVELYCARGLGLYRWMSQFRFMNYRAKIMTTAFLGTLVPLIALVTWFGVRSAQDSPTLLATLGIALLATLVGMGATLFVLNQLLRPVLMISKALRGYCEMRQQHSLPADYHDEVGTLMADAGRTIDQLDATLDALEHINETTGLLNRKRFALLLDARVASGQPFAVAVLRFSNFSRRADTGGPKVAEEASRIIAQRFTARVEFSEQFARVGPSEFACVMTARVADDAPCVHTATRLRAGLDACNAEFQLDRIAVKPTLHGGVAMHPYDGDDAQKLIDRSIAAAAHAQYTIPVMLHSAEARAAAHKRLLVEQDLWQDIYKDEFELHYQPVIDVRAGRAVGAEALIRWHHPQRGLVMPGAFIDAAEASGLIEPIGLWAPRRACAQLREWNDHGRTGLSVSINLSARQFVDPELKRHVLAAINDNGIAADQLEIEFTATAAMVDHDYTRRVFTSLRESGVRIAIDDFGAGYASMSYLRKLPFDKLKIDREFVAGVNRERQGQEICGAMIELAKGLDLTVLAEGTETEEEVRYLTKRGCHLFQGHYFSRAMSAKAFGQSLNARSPFAERSRPGLRGVCKVGLRAKYSVQRLGEMTVAHD